MKKTFIKICSVFLAISLITGTQLFSEFALGGIIKAYAAEKECEVFCNAQYNDGTWAYEDYTWSQQEKLVGDEVETVTVEGVRILDYHGSDTNIDIPEYLDGKPVIAVQLVSDKCLYRGTKRKTVETVSLPRTLKVISSYAFDEMTALQSIVIPAGVETIEREAFADCSALKNVTFLYGEGKGLTRISYAAFKRCTSLSSVKFPPSLKVIESNAFEFCVSLSEVVLNEGLCEIEKYAFNNCSGLKTLVLPESIQKLGNAFIRDTRIEKLDIPRNLKSVSYLLDGTRIKEIVLPPIFDKLTSSLLGSSEYLESLTLEDIDIAKNAIWFKNLKTLIIKGTGEIDENPFGVTVTEHNIYSPDGNYTYYTEKIHAPETVILTDGFNENMNNILVDKLNYYQRIDPETGYCIYSKEYSGEEGLKPQGNSFVSGDYTYDLTADGAIITAYRGTSTGVVTVPDVFENEGTEYPVIAIGRKAFEGAAATEIILPETVRKIEAYAFNQCANLAKTNLPEGITVIEPYTYNLCSSMSEITIPEGVVYICEGAFAGKRPVSEIVIPSSVKTIGSKAFYANPLITSLTLNEGLEIIGENAFANHEGFLDELEEYSLTIPSSIKEIGKGAFEYSGVSGEVVIPESIKVIPENMFMASPYLTSVAMHGGVTTIGVSSFEDCYALESVQLLSGLVSIEDRAFCNSSLTSVVFPSTVTHLGQFSFAGTCLTEVTVPANIKTVPQFCFQRCYDLENVTFENGVEYIENYAFASSGSYESIVIPPSMKEIDSDYVFQYVDRIENFVFNATCYESDLVPCEDDSYKLNVYGRFQGLFRSSGVQIGKFIIGDNVKYIPTLIASRANIEEVVLPDNVVAIGEDAFDYCTIEKALVIPESVKTVYKSAFFGMSVPEITLPEGLENSKEFAFSDIKADVLYYNCTNCVFETASAETEIDGVYDSPFCSNYLKSIVIGENVQTLPDFTFCYITSLETVHIPDNIKALSKGAFAFSGVKTVTGMSGITKLEDYTFYECENLTSLGIENSKITKAGNYAFANSGIESLSGLENLLEVGDYAFFECENLASVGIENSKITKAGNYAFANSGIETLSGLENLLEVGDYAFYECKNLASVGIENSKISKAGKYAFAYSGIESLDGLEKLTEIKEYTFYECKNLTEADLTNSEVTDIGDYAFSKSSIASFTGGSYHESIGDKCFANCASLETVTLGGKLMLIGENAFANCTKLTQITIPDSVKNVGKKAFYGNTALANVKMSDNVIFIPDECFNGCSALETFTWNPESKLIGRLAFANCVALTKFDFINLEKLYDNSFLNSGVTVAQLGEGVDESVSKLEEIETQSFKGCENLATVGIGGNVETIKTQAFADCTNLETAVIADSVSSIAPDAFDGCDNLTIYCSSTSYAYTYAKEQGIPVSTLVIAPIPNQTYTGSKIEPEISVSASGNKLAENVDFGVTYANNVNVGNADVNVKGKGDFRMFASKANFTIVTKNIAKVTVAPVDDQPYTGEAVTPKLTVTDGVKYLVEGKDYALTYYNNIEEGTATVKITGKGNYSGFATTSFVISEEVEELNFFEKLIAAIENFFIRIFSSLVRLFS